MTVKSKCSDLGCREQNGYAEFFKNTEGWFIPIISGVFQRVGDTFTTVLDLRQNPLLSP